MEGVFFDVVKTRKLFSSTTDLIVFRKTFASPQSKDGAPESAEKPAPIAFTRFRMKRAADAPAKSESSFVSGLAELDADLKKTPAPARFKPRL